PLRLFGVDRPHRSGRPAAQEDDHGHEGLAMAQVEMERVAPEAAGDGRAGLLLDLEVNQELGFTGVIRNRRQEVDLSALALWDEGQLLFEEDDAVSGEASRQLAVGQGEKVQEESAEQVLEQPVVAGHGGGVPPPWNRRKTPP